MTLTKQTMRKYKIAAFNKMLHKNSICPGNHSVEYANSWYYFDGEPEQRPEITRKAKEYYNDPNIIVRFNEKFNTYVIDHLPYENY